MSDRQITPLQPKEFFTGAWMGEGELRPHPLFRWLIPIERFRYSAKPVWLSDEMWIVKERLEFLSGRVIDRTMFAQVVSRERLHVTADDMPLGADIILGENGFRFTPYYIWSRYKGITWRLRCMDENLVDEMGTVHDTIRMFLCRFPVALMRMSVNIDRAEN